MARRGFTLLELMIVVIIIGVLATVGIMQYTAAIERARGAEARQVLGSMRTLCASMYLADPTGVGTQACGDSGQWNGLRIGAAAGQIPGNVAGNCQATNYFWYNSNNPAAASHAVILTATRCQAAGKAPQGAPGAAQTLILTTDYTAGTDTWSGTGGY